MKFTCERDALLAALSHAHRIVAKSDAVPILTTALIKAAGSALALAATNGEMVAETTCRAEIKEPGEAAVRLSLLMDILRKLPAGTALRFDRDVVTNQLIMQYRRSRAQLPTLPAEDFSVFGITGPAVEISLPASALAKLLSVPAWVPKADHHVPYAAGIHLHFSEAQPVLSADRRPRAEIFDRRLRSRHPPSFRPRSCLQTVGARA